MIEYSYIQSLQKLNIPDDNINLLIILYGLGFITRAQFWSQSQQNYKLSAQTPISSFHQFFISKLFDDLDI